MPLLWSATKGSVEWEPVWRGAFGRKIQELGQPIYVHTAMLKKPLEFSLQLMWKQEKWKRVVGICIIFCPYFMRLHWLSYGTLSAGLESKIIWTIMAIVTVNVSTTWTLCATWVVLSAFRIACQLCRILCVWTVSESGSLARIFKTSCYLHKNRHASSFCCPFPLIIRVQICFPKDHTSYYEVMETCEAWSGFVWLLRWLINVCKLEASSLHTVGVWQSCVACVVLSALQSCSTWTVCCMKMKYKHGWQSV